MKALKEVLKDSVRILKNAKIEKLKEYSRSYGKPTTESVDYIIELKNQIVILSKFGYIKRVMRKGTKVLIGWSGKEIKVSTLIADLRKEQKKIEAQKEEERRREEERQRLREEKLSKWEDFLRANPEKAKKYLEVCNSKNSKGRRSYIRLKFAEKINNEKFDFDVPAGDLMERLKKVVSENA